jgi:3-deoxy-7-phosphoheptulonate synthase
MKQTDDLRVVGYEPLITPKILKREVPAGVKASRTVVEARKTIEKILLKEDPRLLVIVGPCSIHDEKAALEYAARLNELRKEVTQTLFIVMRVYFEKPRTTVGWKGMINDPDLDGTCDMTTGLRRARRLLMQINEMGLPAGTEMLDTITAQYVADLVGWSAIGARTTESQTHREMASGLSMPVGFKNSTDGKLSSAINALMAAGSSQSFLGIDQDGKTCVVKTTGNQSVHIVLRGGEKANYDPISLEEARLKLIEKNLPETIMVDCSHGNSMKKYQGQAVVWKNVIGQYLAGNESLIGLMLESNLRAGNQAFSGDASMLKYGLSITDECISWDTTQQLLLWADEKLRQTGIKQ